MFRIVLPLALAPLAGRDLVLILAPVNIFVEIGVSIDVDIDIAASPVTISPGVTPGSPYRNTHAK